MNETLQPEFNDFKTEVSLSDFRIQKIKERLIGIKEILAENELKSIQTIFVFGSTANGHATEESDIDIWFTPNRKSMGVTPGTIEKITSAIKKDFPDMKFSTGSQPIAEDARLLPMTLKILTEQNPKHPDRLPAWKFVYSISSAEEEKVNKILSKIMDEKKKANKKDEAE